MSHIISELLSESQSNVFFLDASDAFPQEESVNSSHSIAESDSDDSLSPFGLLTLTISSVQHEFRRSQERL